MMRPSIINANQSMYGIGGVNSGNINSLGVSQPSQQARAATDLIEKGKPKKGEGV